MSTLPHVPVTTALPRDYYLSESIFQKEIEKVLARQWLLVGHVSQVRKAGDYFVKQIGSESLIILRDDAGKIRAYFNVCRHRGFRICDPASAGNSKRFTCPYHAWTYARSGELIAAPGAKDGVDFSFSDYRLQEAWCQEFYGFIYVYLSREAPTPLAQILGPSVNAEALQAIAPERLKLAHRESYVINANWKTVVENDSECYHCGVAHPSLAIACDYKAFYADSRTGAHFPLRAGMKTFSIDGDWVCAKRLGEPRPEGFSTGFLLFPMFCGPVFFADHAVALETSPLSARQTLMNCEWYVHEDAREGIDYDREKLTEVFHLTNLEDCRLMERNYQGVLSMRYVPGPLSATREDGVKAMLSLYLEMMNAP
jgi:phenylpropionate dioxygenase-like ring-hydroxylating dioxygenase large terminal subunit